LVDETKHIYTLIGERYLALCSLRKGAVEGTTEVIRVEDENVFMHEKCLLLSTDFDCNDGLETTSVWLSVMRNLEKAVREARTVVGSSTGGTET
jgi:hypothetical protein